VGQEVQEVLEVRQSEVVREEEVQAVHSLEVLQEGLEE